MKNTKYLNSILTTIAVLLALNLWVGVNTAPGASTGLENQAVAQGRTDAGQQRSEMIDQLKALKDSVDSMSKKLSDGSITVKVEGDVDND